MEERKGSRLFLQVPHTLLRFGGNVVPLSLCGSLRARRRKFNNLRVVISDPPPLPPWGLVLCASRVPPDAPCLLFALFSFFSLQVCLLLTILAIMTLIIERVALGAVCVALHLASTQAFLPSTSLSTSAWKRVSTRGQTVGNDARGDARSAGRGRRAETAMSGGEHDLYVVGAGYLGWVQG